MLKQFRPAITLLLLLTALTGFVYPLALTLVGQTIFPSTANGSMVKRDTSTVGSLLIGQNWAGEEFFHGRPSAAGAGYDASASSGSNLAPTSAKLRDRVSDEAKKLRQSQEVAGLPADAVTASGSGLDPDISPAYALLQVERVAKARGLDQETVKNLVLQKIETPALGVFGEPHVNVLSLNLALDAISQPANG